MVIKYLDPGATPKNCKPENPVQLLLDATLAETV